MANAIVTNKLTDLVALRVLVNAPFLTVGSKATFKSELIGKRNGQEYTFVIKDTGVVQDTLAHSGSADEIKETAVKMSLQPFHIMINTNAIEAVTDLKWDDEVAKPNGSKLANGMVRDAVSKAFPVAATSFVGEGFAPLALAGAHLETISSEKIYGFVDPRYQAILTANGQQFQPVGSPDSFYSKGLLGTFHNVEYRGQRFFPTVKISSDLATWLAGASTDSSAALDTTNKTLKISNGSTFAGTIPAGTPIWVSGILAADMLGDATTEEYCFVVAEDATAASGVATVKIKIPFETFVAGAASAKPTGKDLFVLESTGYVPQASDFNSKSIKSLAAGDYVCGQLRLDGAFEFETLDKLDASNSESKVGNVEGVTVHENRVVDLDNMTNKTRWDIVAMYGNVDPRAIANVYSKIV